MSSQQSTFTGATRPGGAEQPNRQPQEQVAPLAGLVKETTTAAFAADVIQESRRQPVLVDFWASWCGPCKQLTPILKKAVGEASGKVKLVMMNIDEHPGIAGQLGIQSIPAVVAFKDGRPVDGFMGAIPESQVREFIQRVAGGNAASQISEALAAAREARDAGDLRTAADVFGAILQEVPESVEAAAELAGLLVESGDPAGARSVLDRVPDGSKDDAAVTAVRAKIALAEQAAALGDSSDLERRLAENPADLQARFDLAMLQNAKGDRLAAAENLLAIMKADRAFRDDGARTQLLQFFEAWGPNDPATLTARRKLSSLLFS